jgi:hypothetical protein
MHQLCPESQKQLTQPDDNQVCLEFEEIHIHGSSNTLCSDCYNV